MSSFSISVYLVQIYSTIVQFLCYGWGI